MSPLLPGAADATFEPATAPMSPASNTVTITRFLILVASLHPRGGIVPPEPVVRAGDGPSLAHVSTERVTRLEVAGQIAARTRGRTSRASRSTCSARSGPFGRR